MAKKEKEKDVCEACGGTGVVSSTAGKGVVIPRCGVCNGTGLNK